MEQQIDSSLMLPVGTILHDTYRIDGYLGSGGFGNTYSATHLALNERVAVKEFFLRGSTEREDGRTTVTVSRSNRPLFDQQCQKFKKEALRLRKLRSANIVSVHDLFDGNGTAYYVMDYIDGISLSQRMKQQGRPFTEAELLPVFSQLCCALKEVHKVFIQHLDIKPANILLDSQGHLYLIDFGACKQITPDGAATTTNSAMCYTPGYAPLEQMDQHMESVGAWTDIYALGATVYNLLTGEKPPLPSEIVVAGDSAFKWNGHVSERMRRLVTACMQPNHHNRPQDIETVERLLQDGGNVMAAGPEPRQAGHNAQPVSDTTVAQASPSAASFTPPAYTPLPGSPVPFGLENGHAQGRTAAQALYMPKNVSNIAWMDINQVRGQRSTAYNVFKIIGIALMCFPIYGWFVGLVYFLVFRLTQGYWPFTESVQAIENTPKELKIYCDKKGYLGLYKNQKHLTHPKYQSIQQITPDSYPMFIMQKFNRLCSLYNYYQNRFLFEDAEQWYMGKDNLIYAIKQGRQMRFSLNGMQLP